MFQGISPLCFRGCELEGSMIHIWWTCPRIRSFWRNIFNMFRSLFKLPVYPNVHYALLNQHIPGLSKQVQGLSFFILLLAKITLAKSWKKPLVSFRSCINKISWIMSQEHLVAKLNDKVGRFMSTWEPWATFQNINLIPGMTGGGTPPLPSGLNTL